MLGLRCYAGFSPVATSGDYSLAIVSQLLSAVVSLAVEHRAEDARASVVAACGLSRCVSWALSTGSTVAAHKLRDTWHLPRSRTEPVLPALAGRFFPTGPPEKPLPQRIFRS